LDKITYPDEIDNIIDVASANGILGIKLLPHVDKCNLWLSDISFSAYESAKATIAVNNLDSDKVNILVDNSLDSFQADFADLIVINPPFHNNHKVTISTALTIFDDCAKVLKKDGLLIVVANKHLGYHVHLAKLFSEINIINQNDKFVIISATLPS